ncbi:3-dehydroquinate synthase, partial [Acidobacteriota bacterium]
VPLIDLDDLIEKRACLKVSQIFSKYGEAHFRRMEKDVCQEILLIDDVVIATGGKTLLDKKNQSLLSNAGLIFTLLCSPEKLVARIPKNSGQRPLLAFHSKKTFHKIYHEREPQYLKLPNKIDTTSLHPEQVVDKIKKIIQGNKTQFKMILEGKKSSVHVKTGLRDDVGQYIKRLSKEKKAFILSDEKVFSIYGNKLLGALNNTGIEGKTFLLPPGERQKNLNAVKDIYDWLQEEKATRLTPFISFGGGVISDIGGFVASTFHRGMTLVNIPTTLLAQVDASIGGKNGVNFREAKNQIGTFFFPEFVLIDPLFLITLKRQQIKEGLIEALKAGIIADEKLFILIKNHASHLMLKDLLLLSQVITLAVEVKTNIVHKDPFEKGIRKVLNLGHTFGHALEGLKRFQTLSHGQAVGLGMICAAKLAALSNLGSPEILLSLKDALREMNAPTYLKNMDIPKILSLMQYDKKKKEGKTTFIVPNKIGKATIVENVDKNIILKSLKEICHGS